MENTEQAKKFLSALSSHDDGEIFSFQTLYDVKPEHDVATRKEQEKRLTRVIHGRFDDVVGQLIEMNEMGAGVFVCVNRTNGMGLRGKDVERIRSFFVDDDTDHLKEEHLPLPPSIVVRSKRGRHFYWLASGAISKDSFGPAQKALAEKCATDEIVFNLNRVMRIPGFMHNKGEPYEVLLELADPQVAYDLDDVAEAFSLDLEKYTYTPRVTVDGDDVASIPMETRIKRARGMLLAIGPAVRSSGDGHSKSLSAARVGNDFAVDDITFVGLLQEWGASCDPAWDPGQLETFYYSTLGSINSGKWPWGGKLLDDNYFKKSHGGRPGGVSPAAIYRDPSIPWTTIQAENADPRFESRGGDPWLHQGPDHASHGAMPPDLPNHDMRPTAQRKVLGIALPQEQVVLNGGQGAPRAGPQPGHRIGAPIEDVMKSVKYGDDYRRPREIAHHMNQEYGLLQDDSGCVYIYLGNVWVETSKKFIEKLAIQYTNFEKLKHKDLVEARQIALAKSHTPKVNWNQVAPSEIPLNNGVLDIITGEMREHRPADYLDRIIPIDYDPDAKCPLWLQCIEDWLPGMPEELEALQQFFGYILMPHARYKKAMILFGPPDTGKSQICDMAIAIAGGIGNICSIPPDAMDDERKLAPIKGKALNCIADLKKNTVLADGGFKQLVSTGDAVQIDQKFTRSEMYTPTAKHLFATNNLPTIRDATDAVYRRIMIVSLKHPVPLDKQDPELGLKLMSERPGVLNWAIIGARKLYANNGKWPTVGSSNSIVQEYKLTQNPLYFFIEESGEVVLDEKGRVLTAELREKMNEFNGTKPYGRKNFTKLIDGLSTSLEGVERKKLSGKSFVMGLRWAGGQEELGLED